MDECAASAQEWPHQQPGKIAGGTQRTLPLMAELLPVDGFKEGVSATHCVPTYWYLSNFSPKLLLIQIALVDQMGCTTEPKLMNLGKGQLGRRSG